MRRLIADLEAPAYSTRQAAARELARLGPQVEAPLQSALTKASPHLRREIERVREKLDGPVSDLDTLAAIRMVAVLESIATPQSVSLLRELAGGDADARLTREAKAALERVRPVPGK